MSRVTFARTLKTHLSRNNNVLIVRPSESSCQSALWLDFSFFPDSSSEVSGEPIAFTPFRFQTGLVDCCLGDPRYALRLGFLTLESSYLAPVPTENVYLFKQMIGVLVVNTHKKVVASLDRHNK